MIIQDAWSDEDGKFNLDEQQDCENFEWKKHGNVTKFTFTRKFDTCDRHDYIIEVYRFYDNYFFLSNCVFYRNLSTLAAKKIVVEIRI